MNKKILSFFAILLIPFISFVQYAFAVGSNGIENASFSAEAIAQSNAVTAQANEPAAISYNPAGIVQLDGLQIQPNLHFLSILTMFKSRTPDTVPGEKSSPTIVPVPTGYITLNPGPLLWDRVALGIGADSPFGLSNKYDAGHPIVRYAGWRNWFKMYTIKPTVAFKLTDWLSIGGGPMWYRVFDWGGIQAYPNTLVVPGAADGQVRLNLAGQHWGWQAGILAKPHPKHSFGFYFRSPVVIHTKGLIKVENSTLGGNFETGTDAKYPLPLNFTWAYAFKPIEPTTLEFDFGYTRWSTFERLFINHNTTNVTAGDTAILNAIGLVNKDFRDSYSFHLGGNHKINDKFTIMFGSYFYTPAGPNSSFIPAIPDANRIAYSLGTKYNFNQNMTLDVAYLGAWNLRRNINNDVAAALGVSEDGDYTTFIQELSVSFTYKWENLFKDLKPLITRSEQAAA